MKRLRLSIGPREYDAITTALGYFLDTYYVDDEELTPEARRALKRASDVWNHMARERVRQRVGWDAAGRPE